jgi:ATP phosphoribosyltransferase regulatory subunit
VQRLCYAGCVVHANPAWALDDRVPQKAGAEIFGSDTLAADAEVIALLLAVLEAAGVSAPVLVLGHMGIYRGLVGGLSLTETEQRALFAAVQSKSESDIAELLGDRPGAEAMARLPSLMGGAEVLVRARACLTEANSDVTDSVDALAALAELVSERCPGVDLRFDLAELAGYGYHNGPVFSAYQADRGAALARGGRYDGVGTAFGRGRSATGFDVSLKELVPASDAAASPEEPAIWAPWTGSGPRHRALLEVQARLREAGEIVVSAVSPDESPPVRCDRELVDSGSNWAVQPRN